MNYRRQSCFLVEGAEVELWQGFRELARVIYRHEGLPLEFDAEWLAGGIWSGHHLAVKLHSNLPVGLWNQSRSRRLPLAFTLDCVE